MTGLVALINDSKSMTTSHSVQFTSTVHRAKVRSLSPKQSQKMDHSTFIHGVRYPNRIFVGGLPREANATDLAAFFGRFGTVTESKVILNEDGTSKGYGFITFSTSEEVNGVFGQGVIFYKKKKLNLGPAIRKQAPETPGEPILFIRNTPPNPQQSTSPLQMPSSPLHVSTTSTSIPLSPTQLPPSTTQLPPSPPPQQLIPQMTMSGTLPQHCYQSLPLIPTYQDTPLFIPNYPWFPATAC